MDSMRINITGMSCVNCAKSIEKALLNLDFVEEVSVNFSSSCAKIVCAKNKVNLVILEIEKLGFKASLDEEEFRKNEEEYLKRLKNFSIQAMSLAFLVFILKFVDNFYYKDLLIFFIASYVQFFLGFCFLKACVKAVCSRNLDMNVLLTLGTMSAYIYSSIVLFFKDIALVGGLYYEGEVVIIAFVLFGNYLQERFKKRAGNFIESLKDIIPDRAILLRANKEEQVDLKLIKKGDILVVREGEKVPCDGVIISGNADLDTSNITGEPFLKNHKRGDEVRAGSINKFGYIQLEVKKEFLKSSLFEIVNILNELKDKKIPLNFYIDKIASCFVPVVILISILSFLFWNFIMGDLNRAISFSISVLIISCPCALGLAMPISIVCTISRAVKNMILIKNPMIIGYVKDLKFALLDKTGTLTKAQIKISNYYGDKKYLSYIYALESLSSHPVAKAFIETFKDYEDRRIEIQNFKNVRGKGLLAYCEDKRLALGNLSLLDELNVESDGTVDDGVFSVVYFAIDDKVVATFSFEDFLKEDAKDFINNLKKLGVEPVIVTGDSKNRALYIAKELGVKQCFYENLPKDKLEVVKSFQKKSKVLMLGDGVNDALALNQADIAIVVNKGTDIAKELGDIIILNENLSTVINSISLLKKSALTIKQNLFWAFFYNILGIPIAAGIFYKFISFSPSYAGIAMSLSSIFVVLNSLRLLNYKFVK